MQTLKGKVIAVPVKNTVIVAFDYVFRHRKYKKTTKRTTKLAAHNEIDGIKVGDVVTLVKSRPYSKTKHFKLVK